MVITYIALATIVFNFDLIAAYFAVVVAIKRLRNDSLKVLKYCKKQTKKNNNNRQKPQTSKIELIQKYLFIAI